MFIINPYLFKAEPTISISNTINFYENVSYNNQFGYELNTIPLRFYENTLIASMSTHPIYRGIGTVQDPYLIYEGQHFYEMRFNPNAAYRLMNDISLDTWSAWEPFNFNGILNGQGYRIKNANISMSLSTNYYGLFADCGSGTRILNLILDNVNLINLNAFPLVDGNTKYISLLAGRFNGSEINNVHIVNSAMSISVLSGTAYLFYLAPMCGYVLGGAIYSCSIENVNVDMRSINSTNPPYVSLFIGRTDTSNITKCFVQSSSLNFSRNISPGAYHGVFSANIRNNITFANNYIKDCIINLSDQFFINAFSWTHGNITNCYSVVSGSSTSTGVVHPINNKLTSVAGTFYNYEYAGIVTGSGLPKTTVQMTDRNTYIASASWDFTNIWTTSSLINAGYPYFKDNPPILTY